MWNEDEWFGLACVGIDGDALEGDVVHGWSVTFSVRLYLGR
jgi:hypothetical protein